MDHQDANLQEFLDNIKKQFIEMDLWDEWLQRAYDNKEYAYLQSYLEECIADLADVEEEFEWDDDEDWFDDESELDDESDELETPEPERMGFWQKLLAAFGSAAVTSAEVFEEVVHKSNHPERRCNGDCDNCPSHYGYRYGRWYYGHGHQHGCERGGNGGASMRTFRD